jgi:hypothetical protein
MLPTSKELNAVSEYPGSLFLASAKICRIWTEFMYFSGSRSGLILKLKENIKREGKTLHSVFPVFCPSQNYMYNQLWEVLFYFHMDTLVIWRYIHFFKFLCKIK